MREGEKELVGFRNVNNQMTIFKMKGFATHLNCVHSSTILDTLLVAMTARGSTTRVDTASCALCRSTWPACPRLVTTISAEDDGDGDDDDDDDDDELWL